MSFYFLTLENGLSPNGLSLVFLTDIARQTNKKKKGRNIVTMEENVS
jgi:hypothetical protein